MSVEPADRAGSEPPDIAARIARMADRAGVSLDVRQLEQLSTYLNLLRRWNATINLTSLDLERLPPTALERLILEPLIAATLITTCDGVWYDFGSGGGSPALPLKVVLPCLPLTMVESRGRKVAFLRETVRQMGLSEAEVRSNRIDDLRTDVAEKSVQLITMRAVRIDSEVVRAVRHLLTSAGEVVLFGAGVEDMQRNGFMRVRTANGVTLLRSDVPRGTVII